MMFITNLIAIIENSLIYNMPNRIDIKI